MLFETSKQEFLPRFGNKIIYELRLYHNKQFDLKTLLITDMVSLNGNLINKYPDVLFNALTVIAPEQKAKYEADYVYYYVPAHGEPSVSTIATCQHKGIKPRFLFGDTLARVNCHDDDVSVFYIDWSYIEHLEMVLDAPFPDWHKVKKHDKYQEWKAE